MPGEKGLNYYKRNNYVPKHITVDLGGQTAAKAAGGFSSRLVMDVVDERGEKVRGFFTKNSKINDSYEFGERMKGVTPPKGLESLDVIREKIQNHPDGLQRFISSVNSNYYFSSGDEAFEVILKQPGFLKLRTDPLKKALSQAYQIPDDVLKKLEDYGAAEYIYKIFTNVNEAVTITDAHTYHQKQTKDTNINLRNNAMSDYGELIHKKNLVANSTPMTIVNGNEVMHGSFMMNAEGVSYEKLNVEDSEYSDKKVTLTGSAIKQVSDLQILDFLCGNIDRHVSNMFYKLDTSDPDEIKITGVQGIDNDASFGDFDGNALNNDTVYDRMSLIDDIKYIDSETAKSVMALKPEDMEKKIRLAGLSHKEIEAAHSRLELLQEKIRSNNIKIVSSDSEWQKMASDEKLQELSVAKGSIGNIYFNIHAVATIHNNRAANLMNQKSLSMSQFLDNSTNQANNNAPANQAADSNIKGDIPVAKAISVKDNYTLSDHIEFLENVRSSLTAEHNDYYLDVADSYAPFDQKLQTAIDNLKAVSEQSKESLYLSDNQKNFVAEVLSGISHDADEYLAEHPAGDTYTTKICANAAKNLKEYSENARKSVLEDSLEAEKNSASKALSDLLISQGIAPTEHTFKSLAGRVKGISGRSTQFYKDMMTALAAKGDLSKAGNEKQRQKMCDDLIKAAQGYLDHKVPAGVKVKLNTKEKDRVQFAKDLKEYAEAHKAASIGKANEQAREKKDYLEITNFQMKCHALAEQYNNANGADAFDAAEQIRNFKDEFVKGFKNIIAVSDSYGAKHDMQAACGTILKSGVAEFMTAFDACYDDDMVIKGENIYHRLDLDPKYADKVRSIGELGDAVVAKYNKEHPKVQEQQPQKTAVNEKKKDDVAAVPGKI